MDINQPVSDSDNECGNMPEPNPLLVLGILWGISFVIIAILIAIEYIIGREVPASQFLLSFLPAFLAGYFGAKKIGRFITRETRVKIFSWYIISSIIVALVLTQFILDDSLRYVLREWLFILIMVVLLVVISITSYYAYYVGEKTYLNKNN